MNQTFTGAGSRQAAQDRTILKNVYLWMTAGLFMTAVVAKGFAGTSLFYTMMRNPHVDDCSHHRRVCSCFQTL